MLHALNSCKTLQITLLPFLACIMVYNTLLISANSKTIHIGNLISVLVTYHKEIEISHQSFGAAFFFPGGVLQRCVPIGFPGPFSEDGD